MNKEEFIEKYKWFTPSTLAENLYYAREENKQLKERIDKARKHIEVLKEFDEANFGEGAYSKDWEELLEILGE